MARFIARRLLGMVAVLFAISVIVFLIFNVIPNSDPGGTHRGQERRSGADRTRQRGPRPRRATADAVRDDDEADLHRPADVVCERSQCRRTDLGGCARHVLAVHRRGGDLDVPCGPVRLPERRACGQVHRPRADDPVAGRDLDAGLLAGSDPAVLPHLQGAAVPDGQLRTADRGPAGVGVPP